MADADGADAPTDPIAPGAIFDVPSEEAMLTFGRRLAATLEPGQLVCLRGPLGAGKTTLVRGVLQGLGHSRAVKSPTYTLLEPYDLPWGAVYHFDLYRISDPDELELIGFSELIGGPALSLIEWPERGGDQVPATGLTIEIELAEQGRRIVCS